VTAGVRTIYKGYSEDPTERNAVEDKTLVHALAVVTILNSVAIAGAAIFMAKKAKEMDEQLVTAKQAANNTVKKFATALSEFQV
jgi:hypothetical protein